MAPNIRIAVGGILTECNHLGGLPIDMAHYEAGELWRGNEMLAAETSIVGGMLHGLRQARVDPVPLLYASACAGGPIVRDCYDQLRGELLDRLREQLPVSGVLLPLHGAALVEGLDDPEGELIVSVRQVVGPHVPIVVTLDLHANVTPEMVAAADALLAWETYPHSDQYQTGLRAVDMMLGTVAGQFKPTMAMGKVPVLTSAVHGGTDGDGPFARLMRTTKSFEQEAGVLSTSLFLVHPYMDLPGMGSGGLAVTNRDPERAAAIAGELADRYWQSRFELEPQLFTPREAIQRGLQLSGGPVVLVETADCCGGGAAGDSIATLRELANGDTTVRSLVPLVDPPAAAACHAAGQGAQLDLELGHKLDPRWGSPQRFVGKVESLSDGSFTYRGGQWDGARESMGMSAVFAIGEIKVLLMSRATYDWADEQFRAVGLDPATAKFVVAKNPMNHRLAYSSVAREFIVLDTPGPTPGTLKHVEFRRLEGPYFPRDEEIPDLSPQVFH